ncbi:MAG: hypothetical protein ACI9YU_000301 [Flavobacteriales bacterium]
MPFGYHAFAVLARYPCYGSVVFVFVIGNGKPR